MLRDEAARLAVENAEARNTKVIDVRLSKPASKILHREIIRRLNLGHCPPIELLAEIAIRQAYGQAHGAE